MSDPRQQESEDLAPDHAREVKERDDRRREADERRETRSKGGERRPYSGSDH